MVAKSREKAVTENEELCESGLSWSEISALSGSSSPSRPKTMPESADTVPTPPGTSPKPSQVATEDDDVASQEGGEAAGAKPAKSAAGEGPKRDGENGATAPLGKVQKSPNDEQVKAVKQVEGKIVKPRVASGADRKKSADVAQRQKSTRLRKIKGRKVMKKSKKRVDESSNDSDSSSDDSSDDSSSSDSVDSGKVKAKSKSKAKRKKYGEKKLSKSSRHSRAEESEPSDSGSDGRETDDEDSGSEADETPEPATATAPAAVQSVAVQPNMSGLQVLAQLMAATQMPMAAASTVDAQAAAAAAAAAAATTTGTPKTAKAKAKGKAAKGSEASYVRLDHLWSKKMHRFVTQPSSEDQDVGKYEGYAFNVIRHFDYQNRYTNSLLKIMSKHLKQALVKVMGKVDGISLEESTPCINPNTVFLYSDELKAYEKKLKPRATRLKTQGKRGRKKAKELKLIREHVKTLINYLEKDYRETKKSLTPLLKSGKITFDLVWALFKNNDICYSATYGHDDQPRATRISTCYKDHSIQIGDYYRIECQFLDYNGEKYGMAEVGLDIKQFKGVRNITSLPLYPLRFHRDADGLRTRLIERGKKFVSLEGKQYKSHKGMAYVKKDNKVIKVNVDGRIMLDPATFRRVRPNYQFSSIKVEDPDIVDSSSECGCQSSDDADEDDKSDTEEDAREDYDPLYETERQRQKREKDDRKHYKTKVFEDSDDPTQTYVAKIWVPSEDEGDVIKADTAKTNDEGKPAFTDEEYLIASPVALGFSFGEKLWLEFSVSGVSDIEWNEGAFESLIIPDAQKNVVRAMVESHGFTEGGNIDDVIRGKGKGLVAVLHGPPGTGKTLTAEGIAELLRKPLYSVSVGELGTTPPTLERTLTSILDIAHTWSALLLLDEADVFLEERTNFDIHRNALVSIFLRMLEYFQGILFLTTNRVAVFDPAFASRIHVGLRYGGLDIKARKKVWAIFLGKVRGLREKAEAEGKAEKRGGVDGVGEDEIARLASYELNGREIKNAVRTAQSVALVNKETLSMKHLLQVLGVGNVFARDLKGPGYEEAMRSYM